MVNIFPLCLRLTDEAREIFRGLGSSVIQTLGTRDGWVFASQKGSKESPFEKVYVSFLF